MPARRWSDPPPPAEPPASEPPAAEESGGGGGGGGEELWQLEQVERMLHLVVKVFQPQFPPYLAYKHVLPRPESAGGGGGGGPGAEQAVSYSAYCDVHDPEVSEFILRNVCYFCESGAVQAVTAAFTGQSPATLPLVLAHALLASVSNLKVWLNYRTIVQLLVPLRAAILKYMCKFSDGDLRSAASRSMSDFMWSSIKDPLDAPLSFDKDGLDLAFKFFTSSTLTMRLAGISQINNHINIFNELCNGESIVEAENVGLQLANWLIQNQMVEQLFGPNLHVEVSTVPSPGGRHWVSCEGSVRSMYRTIPYLGPCSVLPLAANSAKYLRRHCRFGSCSISVSLTASFGPFYHVSYVPVLTVLPLCSDREAVSRGAELPGSGGPPHQRTHRADSTVCPAQTLQQTGGQLAGGYS